ncbi:hypothetical protein VN12_22840 [Pirellula sp. SH-Sr6A]|nr:hypothetical protein VN12_22840 [Pirellula sp. SH-Sr6A]
MAKSAKIADEVIISIKRKTKRSWLQLRRGCEDLLGEATSHSTRMVGASSRSFARKVAEETNCSYQDIIKWLDKNELGLD